MVIWMLLRSCGPADRARYLAIVERVNTGEIGVDTDGRSVLPSAFKGIVCRDEIYVRRTTDGRLIFLFPTWYGRGADIEGYLYVNGGLKTSDMYPVQWGIGKKPEMYLDVGVRDMLSTNKICHDWYWVSRRLD